MSRAMDPDTVARLNSNENSHQAYSQIVKALSLPDKGLLEFEILRDFYLFEDQWFLKEGNAVAVHKLALVQAFLVARRKLASWPTGGSLFSDDEIYDATAVTILFDAEHLTAVNARKQIIQKQLASEDSDARKILEREKRTIDSIVTSRLHRHTKSPTLWSHRRWLITQYRKYHIPIDIVEDIESIVCVSGVRHPRNYYAWNHARFLVNNTHDFDSGKLLKAVETWCAQNHTDISGWSFLSFLINFDKDCSENSLVISRVLELVDSLRLSNESVWVFLRTLAASRVMTDEAYARFRDIQKGLLETATTPADDKAVLRKAVEWCETYRDC
ncbi:hypothetical protein QBC40DRAFT_28587 [Triangularia verruculosa]|uniref:Uncharacterized protein n=1 Tax=Triangularia verruculosa TaxID=2587418 RepID=A0AAN6X6H0_9PEZI|nr:hypothetical protein QBC40DRAFT_28587 [Triangularia verruculosa]